MSLLKQGEPPAVACQRDHSELIKSEISLVAKSIGWGLLHDFFLPTKDKTKNQGDYQIKSCSNSMNFFCHSCSFFSPISQVLVCKSSKGVVFWMLQLLRMMLLLVVLALLIYTGYYVVIQHSPLYSLFLCYPSVPIIS